MKRLAAAAILLISCSRPALKVVVSKTTLLANGYDRGVFKVYGAIAMPVVHLQGDHKFSRLSAPQFKSGYWEDEFIAGVMPGTVHVSISEGGRKVDETITLKPQTTDWASDGTPDFQRLDDSSDQEAFRQWMTSLAETQYFTSGDSRPREITDCSALVRYSYREALRDHDAVWLASAHLPVITASASIRKYSFPHTLLGPDIFRTIGGSYSASDLTNHTFAEFADARTLQEFNMFFISRDVTRAQIGDVLFYRRVTGKGVTYHSMIFIGASKVKPDGEIYVVYHTGPDGTNNGEIRRITLTQLLHFPNPQWQSIAANPLFLGVYRWNILKGPS